MVYAQFNLGVMYETGEAVKRNLERAAIWYGKAAEQGDVDAIEGLARVSGN